MLTPLPLPQVSLLVLQECFTALLCERVPIKWERQNQKFGEKENFKQMPLLCVPLTLHLQLRTTPRTLVSNSSNLHPLPGKNGSFKIWPLKSKIWKNYGYVFLKSLIWTKKVKSECRDRKELFINYNTIDFGETFSDIRTLSTDKTNIAKGISRKHSKMSKIVTKISFCWFTNVHQWCDVQSILNTKFNIYLVILLRVMCYSLLLLPTIKFKVLIHHLV